MRLEYAAAKALFGILRALPLQSAYGAAYAGARVLDLALPKLRRVGHKNLSFAFPEFTGRQRDEVIDGVFRSIGRMLVALARFPSLHTGNIGQWISYEGLEMAAEPGLTLTIYAAEPGSPSEQALRLLASWAATRRADAAEPSHTTRS